MNLQNLKNKKTLIRIALVIILLIPAVVVIKSRSNSKPEIIVEEPTSRRITEPVNVIPINERPYVSIKPLADGRNLVLNIIQLKKPAQKVDYELEYQSGTMLQMVMGTLEIDQLPVSKQELLGSCSAGGACTYHEDITGGNLLLRFSDSAEGNYVVKSDWRYFDNQDKSDEVASRDAKFQLSSSALATQRYSIVFNSPGYPEGLTKDVIADSYSLSTATVLTGEGELSIRINEESATATIVGFDGESWTEFDTTIDGKQVTAEVELMQFYTVVR